MIQSGILTTIDSTTGQSTGVPVRGAWINFVQNNATKATVQTNIETGAYSVDVPLGKYTVKIAVGDVTGIQRAGQLFELKTGDKADTFQKWFYGETGSIDDDLLKQFKQISNDINASASRAESAEKGAKQIEINMQNNSIGDANGKWLKEGAFGLAASKAETVGNISDFTKALARSGIYQIFYNMGTFNYGCALNLNYSSSHKTMFGVGSVSTTIPDFLADHYINGSLASSSLFYTSGNTKKDKNNVLHATTGTPKDIVVVGDYGIGASAVFHPRDDNFKNGRECGFYYQLNGISGAFYLDMRFSSSGTPAFRISNDPYTYRFYLNPADKNGSPELKERAEIWHTKNTIVDTNGNVKRASPTIELFNDHINFTGFGDQVPVFEKLATGTYKISNTHGMAREGWTYQKPQGKDGNYFFKIRVQKLDDGCIVTVHDYYVADEEIEIIDEHGKPRKVKKQVEVLGMPRDIQDNERWINLRFHEQIYSLTNELPELNVPYRELWGIEPYIPPVVEQIEEDAALEDQRAF